jgi:hypothetical protein
MLEIAGRSCSYVKVKPCAKVKLRRGNSGLHGWALAVHQTV